MLTYKRIAVVGSRKFMNYLQLKREIDNIYEEDDWIISGGATGADSMAQRYAKENGLPILIVYPRWRVIKGTEKVYDAGAGFKRNKVIVENSDIVLAFYSLGAFQEGGTANTATWARKLEVPLQEFEEEVKLGMVGRVV